MLFFDIVTSQWVGFDYRHRPRSWYDEWEDKLLFFLYRHKPMGWFW